MSALNDCLAALANNPDDAEEALHLADALDESHIFMAPSLAEYVRLQVQIRTHKDLGGKPLNDDEISELKLERASWLNEHGRNRFGDVMIRTRENIAEALIDTRLSDGWQNIALQDVYVALNASSHSFLPELEIRSDGGFLKSGKQGDIFATVLRAAIDDAVIPFQAVRLRLPVSQFKVVDELLQFDNLHYLTSLSGLNLLRTDEKRFMRLANCEGLSNLRHLDMGLSRMPHGIALEFFSSPTFDKLKSFVSTTRSLHESDESTVAAALRNPANDATLLPSIEDILVRSAPIRDALEERIIRRSQTPDSSATVNEASPGQDEGPQQAHG